jgi:hypothetical protein
MSCWSLESTSSLPADRRRSGKTLSRLQSIREGSRVVLADPLSIVEVSASCELSNGDLLTFSMDSIYSQGTAKAGALDAASFWDA